MTEIPPSTYLPFLTVNHLRTDIFQCSFRYEESLISVNIDQWAVAVIIIVALFTN
ncbi:unnamed protein product [Brugia timori]|uniref:Uncharacterized protein n=1 Tax=Brugia timori TaxID=42155 RepID=A0A0R3R0R6_9BILA|nr:unnamed protein product [Brugia timori]